MLIVFHIIVDISVVTTPKFTMTSCNMKPEIISVNYLPSASLRSISGFKVVCFCTLNRSFAHWEILLTPCNDHLEIIRCFSYVDCPNIDTFLHVISKITFVNITGNLTRKVLKLLEADSNQHTFSKILITLESSNFSIGLKCSQLFSLSSSLILFIFEKYLSGTQVWKIIICLSVLFSD